MQRLQIAVLLVVSLCVALPGVSKSDEAKTPTIPSPAVAAAIIAKSNITDLIVLTKTGDMFQDRQCYLVVGRTGKTMLIDCPDLIDENEKRVLVNLTTRVSSYPTDNELLALYKSGDIKFTDPEITPRTDPAALVSQLGAWPLTDGKSGAPILVYGCYSVRSTLGPEIYQTLLKRKLTLSTIVLLHGHMDHLGALPYLKAKTHAEVLMHPGDVQLGYPKDAIRFSDGMPKVDRTIVDGEVLTLDGMAFKVIHTPGHSPGGICLYSMKGGKPLLFSGDTLLVKGVGRWNFRDGSGNMKQLFKSITEKLFVLPADTRVLPTHDIYEGPSNRTVPYSVSTIGEEKAYWGTYFTDNAEAPTQ